MVDWLTAHSTSVAIWAGALCTFGIYTVLYKENKFYRFFEHIFIGLYGGYAVYVTWAEVLYPKWWKPMTEQGQWWWVFAAVVGSMFYFMYSNKHAWVSRVIFGMFMGFAAGGIFRGVRRCAHHSRRGRNRAGKPDPGSYRPRERTLCEMGSLGRAGAGEAISSWHGRRQKGHGQEGKKEQSRNQS